MVTHDPRYARHAQRNIYLFDGKVVDEPEPLSDDRAFSPAPGTL